MSLFKKVPTVISVYISNFLDAQDVLIYLTLFKDDLECFIPVFQIAKQLNGRNVYFRYNFDCLQRSQNNLYLSNVMQLAVTQCDSLFIRAYFHNIEYANYLEDFRKIVCYYTIIHSDEKYLQLSIDSGIVIVVKNSVIIFIRRGNQLVDQFFNCNNQRQRICIYNQLAKKAEVYTKK
jgi:hypothetical protein